MSQNHAIDATRARISVALASIVLLCVGALAARGPDHAGAANGRPNVIVVLTDDMTLHDLYERRGNGGRGKKLMPKTRGLLAGKGVTFSRYYSSNSISCPSRTTNLTGQYSKNHGNTRNTFGRSRYCSDPGRVDFARTLPAWLQAAGYRTIHFGRFLNAFGLGRPNRVPEGWDHYVQPVETNVSATAVFYGYRLNVNGTLTEKFGATKHPDELNYFTDVMVRLALKQIAAGDLSQPFYLALDHRAPHEDAPKPVGPQPALRHAPALKGKQPRRPASFDEPDVSDKARWLRGSRRLTRRQKRLIAIRNRRRQASLLSVDDGIARMVARLKELGELDETYILFTSDNGFFNGEHRISKGKYRPYESSSHMPFLIRGPGLPRGRVSGELAANVDLASTVLDAANAPAAGQVIDGRSLLPYARKPKRRSRRPILLEAYPPKPGTAAGAAIAAEGPLAVAAKDPTPPNWRAIVFGRWKLIRFKGQGFELYDLKRDPDEIYSLARVRRYAPVAAFLRRHLKKLERCKGAACRKQIARPPKPPKPRRRR